MSELIFFALATVGLTHILIEGSIFNRPRNWLVSKAEWIEEFSKCFQCVGFWSGVFVGVVFLAELDKSVGLVGAIFFYLLEILCCGFVGSFLSNFSVFIHTWIAANTPLGEIEVDE